MSGLGGTHLVQQVEDRLGFEDHARAATEGGIVDGLVNVGRLGAEVVATQIEQALVGRSTDDADSHGASDELREDREDVDAHRHQPSSSRRPRGTSTVTVVSSCGNVERQWHQSTVDQFHQVRRRVGHHRDDVAVIGGRRGSADVCR